jgi:hypothetical protein
VGEEQVGNLAGGIRRSRQSVALQLCGNPRSNRTMGAQSICTG